MQQVLIFKKMSDILADVSAIEKNRRNNDQKYQFRGIDDVYAEFHPVLSKHRVFCIPRTIDRADEVFQSKSGSRMIRSIVHMEFDFVAEDGSKVTVGPIVGEGNDMSDKATNKAMSVAQKYAFLQTFVVPTHEEKDPENHTISPAADAENRPANPPKSHVTEWKRFVMPFGTHAGKHFDNISLEDLNSTVRWLKSRDSLSPNQKRLLGELDEYMTKVGNGK